ncbi:MAG: phosphoenolpyruvate synthase, partial [Cyclobacteriaceae bacterium]|nr:phosphoenolpyruvate synthase [Cyclobacteriaceae bacterium]
MKFLTSDEKDLKGLHIGGKAQNLFRLKEEGFNVPKWIVIPWEELEKLVPIRDVRDSIDNTAFAEIKALINRIEFHESGIKDIIKNFTGVEYLAVRSSALDEDNADFSYAGQFESYLFVTAETLQDYIKKVWLSAFSERVLHYRKTNNLNTSFGIGVIVQEMIPSEVSGVAFGVNPANGDRRAKVISAVYGLGEGLVSGLLDSDNFIIKEGKIEEQIVEKKEKLILDVQAKSGIKKVSVEEEDRKLPALNTNQLMEISSLLDKAFQVFGKPQDMEFGVYNQQLFVLQSRPVTNLHKIADVGGEYVLWDNSNIIESYPGVTTPLTFSFISKSYEGAYRLFCEFMGVDRAVIDKNDRVFANTL